VKSLHPRRPVRLGTLFARQLDMQWSKLLLLSAALSACCACQGREARAGDSAAARAPTGKKARITPETIAKAKQLLAEHPDAPIGTEMTVVIDGKSHIARFEEHANQSGDPKRPPGKHKGITIYEK
jgi:hypothetical protein